MARKKQSKPKFTDRDAELIDDLRKALISTVVSLPNGGFFDGSTLANQAGFEKAAAKVVAERMKGGWRITGD
jgi:hypothetical protein